MKKLQLKQKLLHKLLNKYYSSKAYKEESDRARPALSTTEINTIVKGSSAWEQYGGKIPSSNSPEFRAEINELLEELQEQGFVSLVRNAKDETLYSRMYIEKDKIGSICDFLQCENKEDLKKQIEEILIEYKDEIVLEKFVAEQLEALASNKTVKYSTTKGKTDLKKLHDVLKGTKAVINQRREIYLRNFSVELYGDSKRMEALLNPICSIIVTYAKAEEFKLLEKPEEVLKFLNVVRNPNYVYFKGNGVIEFANGEIYRLFGNTIGIRSNEIGLIRSIKITDEKLVTIENLTTFNYFDEKAFVVYLGGYHNTSRSELLKRIYEDNEDIKYHHFGDIDAGGFYIYRRLVEQTRIPFTPYKMDLKSLESKKYYWKPLTDKDLERLNSILRNDEMREFHETVQYMLENDCKLEQETF